ncbi:DUF3955 domain-containing protein [Anaerovibrio sp.]|uniref:DUF3955 domain-containing protein n=1 Tax=Anaerovibrio sp. TaxID=1872532 RepID=UPI003F13A5B9
MDKKLEERMEKEDCRRQSGGSKAGIYAGAVLLLIGVALMVMKGMSQEYIDADGILHERFFLLPLAALCFLGGLATLAVTGLRRLFGK